MSQTWGTASEGGVRCHAICHFIVCCSESCCTIHDPSCVQRISRRKTAAAEGGQDAMVGSVTAFDIQNACSTYTKPALHSLVCLVCGCWGSPALSWHLSQVDDLLQCPTYTKPALHSLVCLVCGCWGSPALSWHLKTKAQ
eukprot:1156122-Pelagomonas_calceolata.AAC.2